MYLSFRNLKLKFTMSLVPTMQKTEIPLYHLVCTVLCCTVPTRLLTTISRSRFGTRTRTRRTLTTRRRHPAPTFCERAPLQYSTVELRKKGGCEGDGQKLKVDCTRFFYNRVCYSISGIYCTVLLIFFSDILVTLPWRAALKETLMALKQVRIFFLFF